MTEDGNGWPAGTSKATVTPPLDGCGTDDDGAGAAAFGAAAATVVAFGAAGLGFACTGPAQRQHRECESSTTASKLHAADGTHLLCQQCPAQTADLATKLGSHLVG